MSIALLKELKQNLLEFIEDLMLILPEEQDFILFHLFIKTQVPILDIMKYIIKNIIPLKQKVSDRDDMYFKKHAVLFEHLGNFKSEINRFQRLWDTNKDPEDREMVWRWLESFIDLGEKYQELTLGYNHNQ